MIMPVARLLCGHGFAVGNRVFLPAFLVLGLALSVSAQTIQAQRLLSLGSPGTAGRRPYAGVIQADNGLLYGTTSEGGASNAGTIFRLNPTGGNATNLYTFGLVAGDGKSPMALVQGSDGVLYGTTLSGGTNNNSGTTYKINKDGTG